MIGREGKRVIEYENMTSEIYGIETRVEYIVDSA